MLRYIAGGEVYWAYAEIYFTTRVALVAIARLFFSAWKFHARLLRCKSKNEMRVAHIAPGSPIMK